MVGWLHGSVRRCKMLNNEYAFPIENIFEDKKSELLRFKIANFLFAQGLLQD